MINKTSNNIYEYWVIDTITNRERTKGYEIWSRLTIMCNSQSAFLQEKIEPKVNVYDYISVAKGLARKKESISRLCCRSTSEKFTDFKSPLIWPKFMHYWPPDSLNSGKCFRAPIYARHLPQAWTVNGWFTFCSIFMIFTWRKIMF